MEKLPSDTILNKSVKITVLNKVGHKIDEFSVRGGSNLWVFIRKRGLPIGSACSGVGVCAACCVNIIENKINSVSKKNSFEADALERNYKPKELRLSCLCRVYEDIEIQADYW